MIVKTCKYIKCGKEFYPERKGQMYCCEKCRGDQNRERAREYDRIKREDARNQRKKKASLRDISNKAKELGMSYGMYVAQMEMQKGV